ncbi:hypothetical protein CCY01nite_51760 [Chitinophaga cymbidii]|uniref:START domain-containing protein n=2 Tax=Chitinophaga cymbidii TaxID=1096750 RepID=A0A512RT93_9BACT|nr:hypothetical protein CCY01nite_51760 [Chitinophaga cymbidii]
MLLFMTIVFFRFLFAKPNTGDFRLVKQSENVFLYERWIDAGAGEKVREIKAVFLVHADAENIMRTLKDPAKGKAWNVNARHYQVMRTPDENRWISYIQYDIPWPFDDQDCCLAFHANGREVSFESTNHSAFPVAENMTRISGTRGKWILEDTHSGNVKVTYFITTDRSKKIPRWVSDPIVHGNLIKTMEKFKSLAEQ